MHSRHALLLLAALSSSLGACASTSPEAGFRDMAKTVEQRSGERVQWNQGGSEDAELDRAVHALLSRELSVDGAVQVALLRNPNLLATYEDMSLAQADVVQAGLLKNPVFSASVTTAEREALDPNVIFGVTEDFLDLLMLPARKRVAAAQLEQVKLRIADAVLDLASQVRTAYFSLASAAQVTAMRRVVAEAAETALDLARRQHDAGNISELALANEQGLAEQLKLDLARSETDVVEAHEKMTRLMGLWGADADWRIASRLPELPAAEVRLEHLESLAIAQRLDLAAFRRQTESLGYALSLARWSRFTGVINIGADVARLKNGDVVIGPNASIELPIFDQRQAVIARLEALLRASEQRLAANAVDIRSEVRLARARLVFSRQVVEHYRAVLIPLRERIVALSTVEYAAMLLGVYQLLLAKQAEVNAYREFIEATRDYWIARSDLERAVGGRLAPPMHPEAP